MTPARRTLTLLLSVTLAAPAPGGAATPPRTDEDACIVHALNRLGYGPRPGDVERVRALGLERWIEQQLHPERIDEKEIPGLAALRTQRMSTAELKKGYDVPREVKRAFQQRRAEMENASESERRAARRELIERYGLKLGGPPRQIVEELQQAKLLRATYSERQLQEVLVDFWMNHFNVFAAKAEDRFLIGEYERDVIRPRAVTRFEDLLLATAKSPAMLFYLDNWLSSDPDAAQRMGRRPGGRRGIFGQGRPAGQQQAGNRRLGLNENYARELMELHTLGVDGGYTQKDVTEVARCFTGWTIRGQREGQPRFAFQQRLHDPKDKVVLGVVIHGRGGGGIEEGERVIHMLATHPATARLIAYKLARRFVADEPPEALVARAAAVFEKTGGEIREVVKAIVTAPEFSDPQYRAAKVKTPLEFVVSAVRASRATVADASDLARHIGAMGMPLYLQQPPTGYQDVAEAWVSTSGLLARLNFALDLASGRVRGVSPDAQALARAEQLVPAGLSEQTRKTLGQESAALDAPKLAGLILGSPEFQRR